MNNIILAPYGGFCGVAALCNMNWNSMHEQEKKQFEHLVKTEGGFKIIKREREIKYAALFEQERNKNIQIYKNSLNIIKKIENTKLSECVTRYCMGWQEASQTILKKWYVSNIVSVCGHSVDNHIIYGYRFKIPWLYNLDLPQTNFEKDIINKSNIFETSTNNNSQYSNDNSEYDSEYDFENDSTDCYESDLSSNFDYTSDGFNDDDYDDDDDDDDDDEYI